MLTIALVSFLTIHSHYASSNSLKAADAVQEVASKKVAPPTGVPTNCGPVCGGGTVCLTATAISGKMVTTTATPPAGRVFVFDSAKRCWSAVTP
jgi:hypothetical protein